MNTTPYKAAIYFAGTALLLLICGAILLLALDKTVPDWFQALALADLTGLLGLLATPKGETVSIQQPAGEPVPTREVGHSTLEVAAWIGAVCLVLLVLFALFGSPNF